MTNWKSKYLKYKLKYLNLINQKGGMNSTEETERLKLLTDAFKDSHIRELIVEAAADKNARELYEKKKIEILDRISQEFSYLFPDDVEGITLENLMLGTGIEWKDIEKIEEASVEHINANLKYNYENIIENVEGLTADY